MFTTVGPVYYCLFTCSCFFLVLGWDPGPSAKCSAAETHNQPVFFVVLRPGLTTVALAGCQALDPSASTS